MFEDDSDDSDGDDSDDESGENEAGEDENETDSESDGWMGFDGFIDNDGRHDREDYQQFSTLVARTALASQQRRGLIT
jgi:hypothetical protein